MIAAVRDRDLPTAILPDRLARRLYEQYGRAAGSWSQLSRKERSTWRERAKQSLDALTSLGYRLEAAAADSDVKEGADHAATLVEAATQQAEHLLRIGEPVLAYNAVQQALDVQPGALRLRQLKGLALARSGALRRAHQELAGLRAEGYTDGETLGLLARTEKDLALAALDASDRRRHLESAFLIYEQGYLESRRTKSVAEAYYTGINAATLAFLLDRRRRAEEIAEDVEHLCRRALAGSDSRSGAYWAMATLAEAALVRGDEEAARQRYSRAAELAGRRYGDLSSTRRQARLLVRHRGKDAGWLDEVLRIPPVVVFGEQRPAAGVELCRGLPAEAERSLRVRLEDSLSRLSPAVAYGSGTRRADIVGLECVRELGAEIHLVLPFPASQLLARSTEPHIRRRWGLRLERLCENADELIVVSERPPPRGRSLFEYTDLIMGGLARLRAQLLDSELRALVLGHGAERRVQRGSEPVSAAWQPSDLPVAEIELPRSNSPQAAASSTKAFGPACRPEEPAATGRYDYTIRAMLFADAVGYSRLSEDQIPLFFEHYLGAVADYTHASPHKAAHVETAGDGMYMVFEDPGDAAHYALGLSDVVSRRDWPRLGLPADLSTRIALHCGPVFSGVDPITAMPLYTGTHTSRTARIEPITPPGQVYASAAFAAIAAARHITGVRFSYVGRTQLAKRYGTLALYHMESDGAYASG